MSVVATLAEVQPNKPLDEFLDEPLLGTLPFNPLPKDVTAVTGSALGTVV